MSCGRGDQKYIFFRSIRSGKKLETELLMLKKPPGMQGELQRVIEASKKFGQVERAQEEIHAKHLEWLQRNEPKLLTRQLTVDTILKAAKMMRDVTPTLHQSYFAVINRNREHECREFPSFESVEVYAKDVPEVYEGEIGRIETVVGDVRCIIANHLCPEDRAWLFGEQTIKRYTEVEAFIDDQNQTDRHHAPVVPDRGEDVPPGAWGQEAAGGEDVHGIGEA